MEANVFIGVSLAVCSGLLQGILLLPMKFVRTWRWENIWVAFTGFGYFLLPWVFAALSVPSLMQVYAEGRLRPTLMVFLFGLGWGVSAVLFGLGCAALGMALGFAIILGLGTAAGSLVPLLVKDPQQIFRPEGIKILIGVIMMMAGVGICAWAGKLRDETTRHQSSMKMSTGKKDFRLGFLLCILSGILNPLINFALAFGDELTGAAITHGARKQFAPNVLWALIGTASFVTNAIYCGYLLRRNRTTPLFWKAQRISANFLLAFLMGMMWIGGIIIYGASTIYLGEMGPSVGWPIFMASLIISSNILGILTGEWTVGGKPLNTMYIGLVALVGSVFVIGS